MSFSSGTTASLASRRQRRSAWLRPSRLAFLGLTLGLSAAAGYWAQREAPPQPLVVREHKPVLAPVIIARSSAYDPLLDSGYALGPAPQPLGQNAPLASGFQSAAAAPEPQPQPEPGVALPAEPSLPVAEAEAVSLPPEKPAEAPKLAQNVPLPVRRPSELQLPQSAEQPRVAERQLMRRTRAAAAVAAVTPPQEDNRSFFEKIFGVQRSPGTMMAYAAPEDDVVDRSRGRRLSPIQPSAPVSAQGTAVYDISARVVYMPNGERLEAHSGLGDKMDDPRFVHVRMHGPTPPHVYNLTEREALFHGVRAIRLHPVGGSGAIHGRAGLLAHTYLLGPRGDSNGCISFKDYNKFLQAFLRGEVKRLVVVAGNG